MGEANTSKMFGVLFLVAIFAALATAVADLVGTGGNLTGAAKAIYLLLPLIFVIIGLLLILRASGVLGGK